MWPGDPGRLSLGESLKIADELGAAIAVAAVLAAPTSVAEARFVLFTPDALAAFEAAASRLSA